ncbi:fatty acyl-CoA reductase 1-like [Musca vetustissima]|uniref:fatty acyl-CoA reductase 1 n=1 Tax=Musca vetustissima TaxID=27455 RepID=UPI002AB65C24|nr:fatty acyl-CoA reductase 1 [Musca vetustissima]XP_061394899.1 fatty acyl-CoA reductase 1-like [Musca vetustissima]
MKARPKLEFEKDPGFVRIDSYDENEVDRIALCFAGRSLFITGGTGFMGKVLVEKLLRSCGDLKKMYLLVRPKKGREPIERIKDMLDNVLFDKLKEMRGLDWILSKIEAIPGDVMLPELGISKEDAETLRNEVSLVMHCAATIRFDEPLRYAVFMNVRGTKYMLDLAKTFKKLDGFCYVSTSYCHLHVKTLYEKPYDPPADPHSVMSVCEWLTDEDISSIEKKILGDIPNTYAYTKALAEALVVETFDTMPTAILRPSIVIPIWREPVPGWTDNINGPTGLLIAAGKGVLRTMYCQESGYGDFLPVDVAVNGMLVATWRFLSPELGPLETRVAHMTSSNEIKVSWSEIIEIGRWVIANRVPLNGVAWYPGGSMKSNYIHHWICMILFHWIPALLVDFLLVLLRYPPVLIKVQKRIYKGFAVFEYYANNVWNFDNREAIKLRKLMNNRERLTYVIEKVEFDLYDYFTECLLCARRLILKETDDTIPAAKRHMKIMWWVDKIFKYACYFGILYFIYRRFISDFLFDSST